jgi:hypothetical protein
VPLEALTDEEIPYALAREMRAPTPAPLAALKAYAAKNGLSMEAQARRCLADRRRREGPTGTCCASSATRWGRSGWLASSWRREAWG